MNEPRARPSGPTPRTPRCGKPPPGTARRAAGVTLLELVVVIAIVGILGLIAMPTYRQHLLRARRTDATTTLLRLQAGQERFYLSHHRYAGTADLGALGFADPALSDHGAYRITVPIADARTYTAVATPVRGGVVDMTHDSDCTAFFITADGTRGASGAPDAAERCW